MRKTSSLLAALTLAVSTASAHEYLSLEDLLDAFGMDLDSMEIQTETVAPGIHVLFGAGGNVVASVGEQGVLMVDSQFPQVVPKLVEAITKLGGDGVDFTINTHWHFDHADGNPVLGREGTWIVSQLNSRRMMTRDNGIDLVSLAYLQPAYPAAALPVITYEDQMQFHINGETIELLHFGPAHTTGDTAVLFRDSNVVHMGDVFNAGYPFIDAGNGGDIEGVIHFCESVLERLDQNSIVVPGHGPVLAYGDLVDYVEMLKTVRDRVRAMIDRGLSVDEVIKSAPTREFDERYGKPEGFIDRAYLSLAR